MEKLIACAKDPSVSCKVTKHDYPNDHLTSTLLPTLIYDVAWNDISFQHVHAFIAPIWSDYSIVGHDRLLTYINL